MNTKELPKRVTIGWLSAALLALGASGCGAAEDMSEDEQVGSTSQAIELSEFEKYAVAVMPLDRASCPGRSPIHDIHGRRGRRQGVRLHRLG